MPRKAVLGLMVIAALLRIFDLGTAQLWYDEAFTAQLSRLPIVQLIQATAGDTHPPLYLLLTWLTGHLFGYQEWVLHLPSLLASVAAVWLTWKVAEKLNLSKPVQLAAIVFLVVSPFELHFAQEARMYALLQLEVLWLVLAVLERRPVSIFLASLATLYTHNYGLFYLPAVALVGLCDEMRRPVHIPRTGYNPYPGLKFFTDQADCSNLKRLVLPMGLAVACFLPWVWVLVGQMKIISAGYWIQPVTPGSALYAVYMLFWGFAMPEQFQPLAVVITLGMVALCLLNLMLKGKGQRALAWLALAPLALAVLASLVWKPLLLFRGLIGSVPLLYLWIAYNLVEGKTRTLRLYTACLLAPILAAGIIGQYKYNPQNKGDIEGLVASVRAQWQPGDLVYHINDGSAVTWGWYAPELSQALMDAGCPPDPGSLSAPTRQAMGLRLLAPEQLNARRVWILWGDGPTSTACEQQHARELADKSQLVKLTHQDDYMRSGVWLWP